METDSNISIRVLGLHFFTQCIRATVLLLFVQFGYMLPVIGQVSDLRPAQTQQDYIPDASTLDRKVMFGYQGWHGTPSDGSGSANWRHWFAGNRPDSANATFDVWPDMREYPADSKEKTALTYLNGTPAALYSSYKYETVDLHFKWMKQRNLDGVFEQRFVTDIRGSKGKRHFNQVVVNVRKASEKYQRVFSIMYDITGAGPKWKEELINDWKFLVDSLKITDSERYLHHHNRPLLAIWGLGFSHTQFAKVEEAEALIDWFHRIAPEKYRATILGGVNDDWMQHDKGWPRVYGQMDVISPWSVGRYHDDRTADQFFEENIAPDKSYCDKHHIDYMPVIFPGFSWFNLQHGRSPFNQIPRRGGDFFWHQAFNLSKGGLSMIYIAMFDEVDEGTAMYKIAPGSLQKPSHGKFLSADGDGRELPSDWYLKLTEQVGLGLRNKRILPSAIPLQL